MYDYMLSVHLGCEEKRWQPYKNREARTGFLDKSHATRSYLPLEVVSGTSLLQLLSSNDCLSDICPT